MKFKEYEKVRFSEKQPDGQEYGYVVSHDVKTGICAVQLCLTAETVIMPDRLLTPVPDFYADSDYLGRFLRYEITYAEHLENSPPAGACDCDEYEYTLGDMLALIENLRAKKPTQEEFSGWLWLLIEELYGAFDPAGDVEYDDNRMILGLPYPVNDSAFAECIFDAFLELYDSEYGDGSADDIDFALILEDVDNYRLGKPLSRHLWSCAGKGEVVRRLDGNSLGELTDSDREEVRRILGELIARDDVDALRAAGYAWYGGNDIFPCDWEKSRDCFLRLMELDTVSALDKCQYANTLGYIYYYGRCNGGEPEYGEALRYFTLGAAGGLYESLYKLSDMYVHGYGVPKNTRAASTLVDMVYSENLKRILRGQFDCQFADSALRMGNLARDKIMFGDEYYYYTLADFAIRKRLPFKQYGDSTVFAGIQKELARIRETKPIINKTSLSLSAPPYVFRELFKDYSCMVTVKPLKKGVKITASRLPKPDENTVECVFSCFPEYGACDLVSEMSFTITGEGTFIPAAKFDFIADSFELYDTREAGNLLVFSHHGVELYSVAGEKFTFRLPARPKKDATECNFVSVVFGKGGRQYDYICEVPDVSVGDRVVVFASGEEKSVEVVRVFKMAVGDMPLGPEGYKKILRKA